MNSIKLKNNLIKNFDILILSLGLFFYLENKIFPDSLIIIITGLLLLFIKSNLSKNIGFTLNRFNIILIIFMIYSIITNKGIDNVSTYKYLSYFAGAIYLLTTLIKDGDKCIFAYKIFYYSSIIFTLITILSIVFSGIYIKLIKILYNDFRLNQIYMEIINNSSSGLLGQTGNNAFFISVGIIIVFSKIMIKILSKEKVGLKNIILLVLLIMGLLITQKRGMFLYTCVTIFIIYSYLIIYKTHNGIINFLKFSIPLIVIVIILFNTFPIFNGILDKMSRLEKSDNIMNGREELYQYAIELYKAQPLFGWGINTYPFLYDKISNLEILLGAHNVFLQLLAETGILGTFIFLIAILVNFIYVLKGIINYSKHKNVYSYLISSLGVQMIFVQYFISGNVIYDINMLYTYIIFLSLGISIIKRGGNKNEI